MIILNFFESIRTPLLNNFFLLVTKLGEEYIFLLIALAFVWCIDKKCGYIMLLSGLLGQTVNQFLKITFRVERPWVKYTDFSAVESAIPAASGYSFPSGHTQTASTTYGVLAYYYKSKKMFFVCMLSLVVFVGVSRLYLGVHYFSDVVFSIVFGLFISKLVLTSFKEKNYNFYSYLSVISTLFLLIYTVFVTGRGADNPFLNSAVLHSSKFFGATVAFVISWQYDRKKLNFSTSGKWYFQILKLVLGAVFVLLLKTYLKRIFIFLSVNEIIANIIRYFMIVFFAGTVWPLFFTKIRQKFIFFNTNC